MPGGTRKIGQVDTLAYWGVTTREGAEGESFCYKDLPEYFSAFIAELTGFA